MDYKKAWNELKEILAQEIQIVSLEKSLAYTGIQNHMYEIERKRKVDKFVTVERNYITGSCWFSAGIEYPIIDENENYIAIADNYGQEIRFTYEEADKYLFG